MNVLLSRLCYDFSQNWILVPMHTKWKGNPGAYSANIIELAFFPWHILPVYRSWHLHSCLCLAYEFLFGVLPDFWQGSLTHSLHRKRGRISMMVLLHRHEPASLSQAPSECLSLIFDVSKALRSPWDLNTTILTCHMSFDAFKKVLSTFTFHGYQW